MTELFDSGLNVDNSGLGQPAIRERLAEVRSMPEASGSFADAQAGGFEDRGMGLSQRVPPQPGSMQPKSFERGAHDEASHRDARDGEHKLAVRWLVRAIQEEMYRLWGEGYDAIPVVRLWWPDRTVVVKCSADAEHIRVEVERIPTKGGDLPDPQPGEQTELGHSPVGRGQGGDDALEGGDV